MSVIVRGVSKRMGKNDVLRNVSIEVDPGTVVGLQGINGSVRPCSCERFAG